MDIWIVSKRASQARGKTCQLGGKKSLKKTLRYSPLLVMVLKSNWRLRQAHRYRPRSSPTINRRKEKVRFFSIV
jgi:hypothetical protein